MQVDEKENEKDKDAEKEKAKEIEPEGPSTAVAATAAAESSGLTQEEIDSGRTWSARVMVMSGANSRCVLWSSVFVTPSAVMRSRLPVCASLQCCVHK